MAALARLILVVVVVLFDEKTPRRSLTALPFEEERRRARAKLSKVACLVSLSLETSNLRGPA